MLKALLRNRAIVSSSFPQQNVPMVVTNPPKEGTLVRHYQVSKQFEKFDLGNYKTVVNNKFVKKKENNG